MDAMFHALADTHPARAQVDSFRSAAIAKPHKAFAMAFVVLATALAGCASGLGANSYDPSQLGRVARVEEGMIVAARPITIDAPNSSAKIGTLAGAALGGLAGSELGGGHKSAGAQSGYAYTIRLPSGELVSVAQAGAFAMPAGTPVLIEYGARARVIPQNLAYGY
jgi:outer membrane lipoprotein SlyB